MNKPIIVFTNFWDANKLLAQKDFVFLNQNTIYRIRLRSDPSNYNVHSIALSHPKLEGLPNIKKDKALTRLDFFCPTYEMLRDHKNGGPWTTYETKFKALMKARKNEIKQWFSNLIPDTVYILCCWENTAKGAHCHRQILYHALSSSATMADQALYVYRHGTWNEDYLRSPFFNHLEDMATSVVNFSNIPVFAGQAIAESLGMPSGAMVGTASGNDGSWQVVVDASVSHDFNAIFGNAPVSMSTNHGENDYE